MATRLLLLDESLLVQRVVELAYRDKGVDIQIAENADEALEMAENAAPDIVVASLDMEGSDGLGFCRRLREKPDLSQIPLLVLTSTRNSVSDEEIQEVDAAANIEKPFKPIVFTDEVERIIGPGHIASTPEPEAQAEPEAQDTGIEESPSSPGDATGESVDTPSATAAEETPEQMEAAPAEAGGAESTSDENQTPSSDAPLALDSETLAPIIGKYLEEAVDKIAPTLLSHIEEVVVKQLPYIVEKIVIREIEKIKRGE